MDRQFLIDTNIIIYHIGGKIPLDHKERIRAIFKESFNISTITKIEVLGWKTEKKEELERIKAFLEPANIIFVDENIQKKTIEIKQAHKIKTPDAIIGATALLYGLTVVTRNESDFNLIEGLSIYNPFKDS